MPPKSNTTSSDINIELTVLRLIQIYWAYFWRLIILVIALYIVTKETVGQSLIANKLNVVIFGHEIGTNIGFMGNFNYLNQYNFYNLFYFTTNEAYDFLDSFAFNTIILWFVLKLPFKDFRINFSPTVAPRTSQYFWNVLHFSWAWTWRANLAVLILLQSPLHYFLPHLSEGKTTLGLMSLGATLINLYTLALVLKKKYRDFRVVLAPIPSEKS